MCDLIKEASDEFEMKYFSPAVASPNLLHPPCVFFSFKTGVGAFFFPDQRQRCALTDLAH